MKKFTKHVWLEDLKGEHIHTEFQRILKGVTLNRMGSEAFHDVSKCFIDIFGGSQTRFSGSEGVSVGFQRAGFRGVLEGFGALSMVLVFQED